MTMMQQFETAVAMVEKEYLHAIAKHGPFNSRHEAYAVILEELDELWDEIKKQSPDTQHMSKEAAQVACVAIRFLIDCGGI
jgi:hypothetical protein